MRLPRILYLADSLLPPGGIQTLSRLTISVLHDLQQGGRVKYNALVRNGPLPADARAQASLAYGYGPFMQARVAWQASLGRADCIFSDHLYTARFASRLNKKHIFWTHLIELEPPLHEMHRRSLESSYRIVCNSNHTLAYLAKLYPQAATKLRAVQLGDQLRQELAFPLYEKNLTNRELTIVGRMDAGERYKGHDQILECLPRVLSKYPDCKLNIVGEGSDLERLRQKAVELRLTGCARFLGSLTDPPLFDVIRRSTGLLLPSLREGFGLVYLYAMWAGIPAVAVAGTVAEEVLGPCGVYASNQTSEAIAEAIETVLSGSWQSAEESQRRYAKIFSYDAFKKRLTELLLGDVLKG